MKATTIVLLVISGLIIVIAGVGAIRCLAAGERQEALFVSSRITCGACANNLQQALLPLSGVKGVSVEVAQQQVRVGYDPQAVDPERIAQALNTAGYPARLVALGNTAMPGTVKNAAGGCGSGCCPPRNTQ